MRSQQGADKKKSIGTQLSQATQRALRFVTIDIWRITDGEVKGVRSFLISIIKTLIISIQRFRVENVQTKASALTYNTLLAIVPVLALMFAFAKGLGFENLVQTKLFDYFPAQREGLLRAKEFVDLYLEEARTGGLFVGIGVALLLWAVIVMINNIERAFNQIWQIKKPRSVYRKITDYTSLFLILPVLMILSSGLSLLITTTVEESATLSFMSPVVRKLIEIGPYIITCLAFTGIYMFIPNTKVKFGNALFSGILCGSAFQIFQFIYMSGQLWVTRYNAIYGSFAVLPLLLLWLQLSWLICLFGAVLTYSSQNIRNYDFEQDSENISRRYRDFLTLVITSVMVDRFRKGKQPYTIGEISYLYRIPSKLTVQIIDNLLEIGIISETPSGEERVIAYQPAVDVNTLSVGSLLKSLDEWGSENFKVDKDVLFNPQWQALIEARGSACTAACQKRLIDFDVVEPLVDSKKKKKQRRRRCL